MSRRNRAASWALLASSLGTPLFSQTISLGVIGGFTATPDYTSGVSTSVFDDPFRNFDGTLTTRTQTITTRRWTPAVGASMELGLPRSWSIEVDLLRTAYRGTSVIRFDPPYQPSPDRPPIAGPGPIKLSEAAVDIPVLGKYRLAELHGVRPFLEAGMSFRPWLAPASLSRRGYVVGGGLQFRRGTFVFEPTVRFTRWPLGYEASQGKANQNELQFLLGVHRAIPSGLQGRLNQSLSLGVLGGFSFLNDYADKDGQHGYRSKLVGVAFDYRLAPKWSVEMDALYHQLILSERAQATVLTWGFPVLAKYRMSAGRVRPFLEAGPNFRVAGNTNGTSPSHIGGTAGLGMEAEWHKLKIAPVLRFNYRTPDGPSFYSGQTTRNQLTLLVGLSL